MKTKNGVVTKYVYGKGLIGEEVSGAFKTYHFDYRGSTVAITDIYGNITDTFKYDTYGKPISRTGNSFVIFGYNGRDGVVTDKNGLIYMRARYYSTDMRRFVNADIIPGEISNAVTLNRYAYANGNPISFVDPLGLSVWSWIKEKIVDPVKDWIIETANHIVAVNQTQQAVNIAVQQEQINQISEFFKPETHKIEGDFEKGSLYGSGSVSGDNNDFNFSDKGEYDVVPEKEYNGFTGVEAGLSVANAEGEVGYRKGAFGASIGGDIDVLNASAVSGIAHGGKEKGMKLGAGASVVSGQAGVTFELFGIGFEFGVSADVLTAEARLNAGMIETKGKKKLSFGAEIGPLLFGFGFDIGITIPA